jgi:AbrB family looped-hinge helix DNA binding protein
MKEFVATISSKGQVTIPVEIRKRLGLNAGRKLAFVVDDEGRVSLRPPTYPTIASLAGAAGKLPKPMTWEEMRQIARDDYVTSAYGSNPKR